ncbi:hypothetical protein D0Z07_6718 [Hyphodiscus hymeniophilus]|uniref:Uncharacterized protein n=1 Tax=Hyphodiscus hymeniophilus TaxID=353542 RepID=A0A9P7AVP6_9HELO|nr:hypothetical protein D0Z07_6718 [Hyphodiscus hymeniophilus]
MSQHYEDLTRSSDVNEQNLTELPPTILGPGVVDPFDSLSPGLSKRTEDLIYHSKTIQGIESDESLVLSTEAISIINQRLEDGALNDGTISAVACLAGLESFDGSLSSVKTHMDGLEQMIKTRGGLIVGDLSLAAQRLESLAQPLVRADLGSANAMSTSPRFDVPDWLISDNLHNTEITRLLQTLENLKRSRGMVISAEDSVVETVHHQLSSVFESLHALTDILDWARKMSISDLDDICYSDWLYLTQRALMFILENSKRTKYGLDTCCSIAGLIYVECCLRDANTSCRIVCDLVARLVDSLEQLKIRPRHEVCHQVYGHWIFWAIFVGAVAAEHQERSNVEGSAAAKDKLMRWLAAVSGNFIDKPWLEVEKSLRAICWSDMGGTFVGAFLWDQI